MTDFPSTYRFQFARIVVAFMLLCTSECLGKEELTHNSIDLNGAQILTPADLNPPERKSIELLVDEIAARTRVRLPVVTTWPRDNKNPVIAVGTAKQLAGIVGGHMAEPIPNNDKLPAEGFRIRVESAEDGAPLIYVSGNDSRGVLFGIGKLLRSLQMSRDRITLAAPLNITSAPAMPIRGHQLGYRPKTNSYDAWNPAQWEQYIRDLAVFGCNSIELIPPRSDDDADSPHFPLPPMEMMIRMSKLAADYDLDVWIWFPAMESSYARPESIRAAVKEWGDVLARLPRVNALFVPSGDPGDAPPGELMSMLAAQAEQLKRLHPNARIWVSVQSFEEPQFKEMLAIIKSEPEWLGGIVYGPQTRVSIAKLREMVPRKYPIRGYPDITHSMRCEYPVPDWDPAFALTEGREVINPRPLDETTIFQLYRRHTAGIISYSEGCNDDVNKMIWSALCWNPDSQPLETLREYSRYFIGAKYNDDFSAGVLALEQNWRGPLVENEDVEKTLQRFTAMEREAAPRTLRNWRFQQALYRAYYDAYERRRLMNEQSVEAEAMNALAAAKQVGPHAAIESVEAILDRSQASPAEDPLERRVNELAEALFQSIGMQLSVGKYQAIEVGRGANLDELNVPLNDRQWLKNRFAELRKLPTDAEAINGIERILHWMDPGPGGFYDDLGDPKRQPHLLRTGEYAEDPGFLETPFTGFSSENDWRRSWRTHTDGRYQTPVRMQYRDLDRAAKYKLRVVYAGDNFETKVALSATSSKQSDGREIEIHPFQPKPSPVAPIEFEIPPEATSDGNLTLTWRAEPQRGGAGRGCQVAEVWLMKLLEN